MGASVRPVQSPASPLAPGEQQNPADLWEQLVASGMNKADATVEVQRRTGVQPGGLTELIIGKQTPPEITQARELARSEGTGGRLMNALAGAVRGIPFSDEVFGGAAALLTGHPIRNYRRNVEYFREHQRMAEKENPGTVLAGEFAGGMLIPGGSAATATKLGLKQMAMRGLAAGAGMGALAGAGASEGGLQERAEGGVQGAAVGALAGAVVPPLASGAGRFGGVVADISGVRRGVDKLAERLGKNILPIESNKQRAARLLFENAQRDNLAEVPTAVADLVGAAKKPLTPMDVGGENIRGLARAGQSIPSKMKQGVKETLDLRQEDQYSRIVGDLDAAFGRSREDVFQRADELAKATKTQAKPFYEKSYAYGELKDPETQKLFGDLLQVDEFRDAYEEAVDLAKLKGIKLPKLVQGENGAWGLEGGGVTVQAVDYVKRVVDPLIKKRVNLPRSQGGLSKPRAGEILERKNALLARVDDEVEDYKTARRIFGGDAANEEALQAGREFLRDDARLTARAIREMSESEREQFRVGAMDAIRRKMDTTDDTRDLYKTIFGNREKRAQLQAAIDNDKAFREFEEAMKAEKLMFETRQGVIGGSPTARIQAEQMDVMQGVAEPLTMFARGQPLGALSQIGGQLVMKGARGTTEQTLNALAPLITTTANNPVAVRTLREALQEAADRAARQNARRQAGARGAGVVAGGSTVRRP